MCDRCPVCDSQLIIGNECMDCGVEFDDDEEEDDF